MANDAWVQDYKVLDAMVMYFAANPPSLDFARGAKVKVALADVSPDWEASVRRLSYTATPPYLVPDFRYGGADATEVAPPSGVTERALRVTNAWPSEDNALDRLVAALTDAAENEPDPAKRGKAQEFARWLAGAGRDVGVGVAVAFAKSISGLS